MSLTLEQQQIVELSNKLLKRLLEKAPAVQNKYDYYNADNEFRDFGISVPKKMMNNAPGIGWASRAVNTLSDRVVYDGLASDTFGMNDLVEQINGRPVIRKATNDAFIAGCAFIAVSETPKGKVLVPFTATEATGVVDQTTGLLQFGLAVTAWQVNKKKGVASAAPYSVRDFVLFTKTYTAIFKNRELTEVIPNNTGRVLMQQITRRSSADQPLGKSRITKTVRRIIQEVARVKRRYEIAGEFYSTPQRYMVGLAEGSEIDSNLSSALGKVWTVNKDEEGDKPEIGQLAQMSINQFEGNKKDLARDFCAETGLTLRNLGYETANPTSAESLSAMSDDLLLEAQAAQEEMGEQIRQILITLRMAIDDINTPPDNLLDIQVSWKPIFQIDIGSAGDAMFKLFDIMPELQGTVTAYKMLGISIQEAEQLAAKRTSLQSTKFMTGGGDNA